MYFSAKKFMIRKLSHTNILIANITFTIHHLPFHCATSFCPSNAEFGAAFASQFVMNDEWRLDVAGPRPYQCPCKAKGKRPRTCIKQRCSVSETDRVVARAGCVCQRFMNMHLCSRFAGRTCTPTRITGTLTCENRSNARVTLDPNLALDPRDSIDLTFPPGAQSRWGASFLSLEN